MNDLIRLAMEQAAMSFGRGGNEPDGLFSAAGFSEAMMRLAGLNGTIDGLLVRVILAGRPDVDPGPDQCHYRLRPKGLVP